MDILFRLIKDGKVVGYEKHENGRIYHKRPDIISESGATAGDMWRDIFTPTEREIAILGYSPYYIEHDRKDLWTGIEIDGVKVFERDQVIPEGFKRSLIIEYYVPLGMFVTRSDTVIIDGHPRRDALANFINEGNFRAKIIGTEGVE